MQAYRNLLKVLPSDEKGEVGDIGSQGAKLSEDFPKRFRMDTRSFRVRPQGAWSLKMQEDFWLTIHFGRGKIFFYNTSFFS